MSDFSTDAEVSLEVKIDQGSLGDARRRINDELGATTVGVTDGGTASAQSGRAIPARQRRRQRRTFRLDRERNDLLQQTVGLLDEIEESAALGGGGGGGGKLGGLGGDLLTGAGLASLFSRLPRPPLPSGGAGLPAARNAATTAIGTSVGAFTTGITLGSIGGALLEDPSREFGQDFAELFPDLGESLETAGLASGLPIFGASAIDFGEFLTREDSSLTFDDTNEATERTIERFGLLNNNDTISGPPGRNIGSGAGVDVNTAVTDPTSADFKPVGTTSVDQALEGVDTSGLDFDIDGIGSESGTITADGIRQAAASRRDQRATTEQQRVTQSTEINQTTNVTVEADTSNVVREVERRIDDAKREVKRELTRKLDRTEREIRRDISGN